MKSIINILRADGGRESITFCCPYYTASVCLHQNKRWRNPYNIISLVELPCRYYHKLGLRKTLNNQANESMKKFNDVTCD